jgi:hypothetical protein
VNEAAISWALSIPCKPELSGVLLRLAARADDQAVVARKSAAPWPRTPSTQPAPPAETRAVLP